MKKNHKVLLVFSLTAAVLMLCGCGNSYDNMIDDFNNKYFEKGYLAPAPYTTESSGFNEHEMLEDTISMLDGSMSVFIAPDGGESCTYEWKAHIPSKNAEGKDYMKETVIGTDRTLSYTAPGVFNSDKENKLTVTVTEASGKKNTDTAKVFITVE